MLRSSSASLTVLVSPPIIFWFAFLAPRIAALALKDFTIRIRRLQLASIAMKENTQIPLVFLAVSVAILGFINRDANRKSVWPALPANIQLSAALRPAVRVRPELLPICQSQRRPAINAVQVRLDRFLS